MAFFKSFDMTVLPDIVEGATCGLVLTDVEGRIVFINGKAEDILGIKAKSALGKPADSQVGCFLNGNNNGANFTKQKLLDKELILYKAPFQCNGKLAGRMYLFDESTDSQINITAPASSLDMPQTLESVMESFYDGIIILENCRIAKVNSSFSRITGLKGESILNRKVEEIDGETHVCLHTIQEVVRLVQQLKKSITSMGKLKQGNEIYVTGTPVMSQGNIAQTIIHIRDITELQLLKDEVSRLMAMYLSTPEDARILQITGGEIIAENRIMRGVLDLIARVAQVDTTVLLEGESGTGKEVMARLIHRLSARRCGPFIPVNCGAIPENLFETELFGYVRGAFTNASREGKPGLFELANQGVIFLDEIGELPLSCQVKLLKVIEDFEIMRVGGVSPVKLNVRILAATNKNLKKMVKDGDFREDLFYRLYVVPIEIPPLRTRREDIFPLAWHFVRNYNNKFNQSKTFSPEIIQFMESYHWPGNVRELQNVIERMVIISDEEVLQPYHLPHNIYQQETSDSSMIQVKGIMPLEQARAMVEKKLLAHVLSIKKTTREAARLLGVDHSTVVRKLKKYGFNINEDLIDG
ncbi:MAG TPA: PAS domain S-box protein [Nitrospirae bacterium]|nr:limonene hydroxylase [bacterium BMS3Abin08]HDY70621.1 PAS domain S-box protein [Nitrospirota bacterium]